MFSTKFLVSKHSYSGRFHLGCGCLRNCWNFVGFQLFTTKSQQHPICKFKLLKKTYSLETLNQWNEKSVCKDVKILTHEVIASKTFSHSNRWADFLRNIHIFFQIYVHLLLKLNNFKTLKRSFNSRAIKSFARLENFFLLWHQHWLKYFKNLFRQFKSQHKRDEL